MAVLILGFRALPKRKAKVLGDEEDDQQEDKEGDARVQSPKQLRSASNTLPATSDFEKLFWEKRGDNNRAWKGRRRAVLKEKSELQEQVHPLAHCFSDLCAFFFYDLAWEASLNIRREDFDSGS